MSILDGLSADWFELLSERLGADYDFNARARATGALLRGRIVRTGQTLVHLCLAYGFGGLSFRSTAAFAEASELAALSDVAVMKRLHGCPDFLTEIACRLVARRSAEGPLPEAGRRLRLIDATAVSRPGSSGTDARLHLCLDPDGVGTSQIELTDVHGGEKLTRFAFSPGDIVLADSAYARCGQIEHALGQGADVLLRAGINSLAFAPEAGGEPPPALADWLAGVPAGDDLVERGYVLRATGTDPPRPVRLIALRLEPAVSRQRARRAKRKARDNKGGQSPAAAIAAQWLILVTTLPAETYPPRRAVELYRVRWQVELAFKRLKSLTAFAEVRAKKPALIKVHLLANLIVALLAENQAAIMAAIPP